ncbi:hypothetical protein DPEC_G00008320 [Dallia pectoralis]|uniref:Uncharacterized protein n=1 Tax=Dallia pectoralis TaxID=75939 RepID=A0ACC2HKJ2_DALPE|nr:hypothetical protein DPEC_G00008320 [Dallia pectoralis]
MVDITGSYALYNDTSSRTVFASQFKGRDLSHLSHQEALHILASCYEQPITTQIEGQRRKHNHSQYPECSTERPSWEVLRALGVVEGTRPGLGAYAAGPYYDRMALPPDIYTANGYLPSVPYNLEDLNRLEYSDETEMMNNQPSNSCLIGCCNTDNDKPSSYLSQSEYEGHWLDRPTGYLPLHELDSGLGCTDGSLHQEELSDPETEDGVEAPMSSPPGHTSRGSSPSSESLLSSELSDSGFHSVSTGDFRHFQKVIDGRVHNYRSQCLAGNWRSRSRWDLESIPETLSCDPQTGPHRAMTHQCHTDDSSILYCKSRSPQLTGHGTRSAPRGVAARCRTEPCQRRALMLNQRSSADLPSRSYTVHDLSDRRRASQPALIPGNNRNPAGSPNHLAVPIEDSMNGAMHYHRDASEKRRHLSSQEDGTWHREYDAQYRGSMSSEECNSEEQCLSRSPSKKPPGKEPADWRQFATLGHPHIGGGWPQTHSPCDPLYSTLDGPSARNRRGLSGNPRAVRNQLLKARASQLADERSEVTTDEEARGEAWAGRYWNRTERRRHLALARDQRQRRLCREADGMGDDGAPGGCSTVLELSHRKQSRLRNHKLLDDWTTVEELLTHGTRVGEGDSILCHSPLLSVTTV